MFDKLFYYLQVVLSLVFIVFIVYQFSFMFDIGTHSEDMDSSIKSFMGGSK